MLASILLSFSVSEPVPPRLEWEAPPSCPDHTEIERRAQQLAGLDATTASLRVRGRVERRAAYPDTPWHLDLVVATDGGEHARSLDAAECDALADVTALVLALGLDPFGLEPPSPPSPSSPDPETVTADEPAVVPASNGASPVSPRRVRRHAPAAESTLERTRAASPPSPHAGQDGVGFGLRVLAGGELGALPGGSGGGRVAAALLIRRFRFEAHGNYWLPRPARLPDGGGLGVDVRLATGGVDVCVRLYAARRLELPVCAGAEVGLMRADAVGAPEPERAYSVYAAAWLAPAISWRVADWVGLWLGVEGTLALSRPRFRFGEAEVYTPAPAGGRVLGGVEFGF